MIDQPNNAGDKKLNNGQFSEHNQLPYCSVCYGRGFGPKGFGFGGVVATDSDTGKDRFKGTVFIDEESPMEALKKKKP